MTDPDRPGTLLIRVWGRKDQQKFTTLALRQGEGMPPPCYELNALNCQVNVLSCELTKLSYHGYELLIC